MTKIVAIDAGHGKYTAGKRTPDGEREWYFNDKVARAAIAKLQANGVKVIRTDDPTGETDVSLTTRTNRANNANADVMASIHHNANTGKWGDWTGTETFTYLGNWPEAERLAREVQKRMLKAYGLKDRGLKKANFAIVRQSKMPAILTEGGYMDSRIDIKKLRNDTVLKNAGIAIAEGILAFLGVSSDKGADPKPSEVAKPNPNELYRVRWSWGNAESQKGAFSNLANAKEVADKYPGYKVYDSKGATVYQSATKEKTGNAAVREAQEFLNSRDYPTKATFAKLDVDGYTGPKSINAGLQVLQYFGGVSTDGIWGRNTEKVAKVMSTKDYSKWWTHLLQAMLVLNGVTVGIDGVYGSGTKAGVVKIQKAHGLVQDGIVGPKTWKVLCD